MSTPLASSSNARLLTRTQRGQLRQAVDISSLRHDYRDAFTEEPLVIPEGSTTADFLVTKVVVFLRPRAVSPETTKRRLAHLAYQKARTRAMVAEMQAGGHKLTRLVSFDAFVL